MHPLPYRIEHTRNRTSRATFDGNEILIRLAGNLPRHEEQRHIQVLLKRMTKRAAAHRTAPLIDPFQPLLNGAASLSLTALGDRTIVFNIQGGKRTRATRTAEGWNVTKAPETSERTFHRFLWRLTSLSTAEWMEEKVRTVNMQTFNADVRSVRTRYMRARFGSCGRRGQIAINTALLFVPEPLLDYVIVHELAHIGHSNHSQHFWQSVGSMIPDYKIRSKQLKRYRLPEA